MISMIFYFSESSSALHHTRSQSLKPSHLYPHWKFSVWFCSTVSFEDHLFCPWSCLLHQVQCTGSTEAYPYDILFSDQTPPLSYYKIATEFPWYEQHHMTHTQLERKCCHVRMGLCRPNRWARSDRSESQMPDWSIDVANRWLCMTQ